MARKNLIIMGVVVALIAVAGVFFITSQNAAPGAVRVLVIMSPGDTGEDMIHATELALQEAKEMAGSRKVELITLKTDDAAEIIAQVKKHENDQSLVAVIGATSSGVGRQLIPVLNPLSLSLITPAATWPGLTKPGFAPGEPGIYYPTGRRNFFRVLPSDDIQGKVAVGWLKEAKLNTIYVVYNPTSPYASGLAGIVVANAEEARMKVAASEPFDPMAASPEQLNALADKIIVSKADAVYYAYSGPKSFDLALALRSRKPDLMIVGGDGLVGDTLPTNSASLNGIVATNGIEPTQIEAAAPFVDMFKKTYNKTPSFYVLTAYEAMRVLLRAIEIADKPTREGVLTAMGKIGEFKGAMGTWKFDANGDTSVTTFTLVKLDGGQWKFVQVFR